MRIACLIRLSHLQLHTGGIIILKDTSEEEEELVEPVSAHGPKIEEEEQEPEPPEPFEYIDEWKFSGMLDLSLHQDLFYA